MTNIIVGIALGSPALSGGGLHTLSGGLVRLFADCGVMKSAVDATIRADRQ